MIQISLNHQDSIFLITSSDNNNTRFGTGFSIRQGNGSVYVLTCAHVVRDVGGSGKVLVEGIPASVVASGEEEGIDLAVLKVDGLWDKPILNIQAVGEKGNPFVTAGFQAFDKDRLIRPLEGNLGDQVGLQSLQSGERVQAWDLCITTEHPLQPGYSGSPVIDQATGTVLGVVSHRQGESRGLAISIRVLNKIWQIPDSEQLFRTLLTLGYRSHERLFRKLSNDKAAVAAFLIHGLPEYGPSWLLNRLLVRHISSCITGKVIKVRLTRRGRKLDVDTLWRELGGWVGLRERLPLEIAGRIYQWWQTQDVIIIIHAVNFLPESELHKLVQDFWSVLIERVGSLENQTHSNKLFMFLLDYEEAVENWQFPFAERVDTNWKPDLLIKFPNISKFSDEDLLDWIDYELDRLPEVLKKESDRIVQEILDKSDNGIPEYALDDICSMCGWNWYEESEKWLQRVM